MKININNAVIYFLIPSFLFAGCKKLIEVDPPVNQLSSASAYSSNASASAVLTGIYSRMQNGTTSLVDNIGNIGFLQGLRADELTCYVISNPYIQFYQNALNSSNNYYWSELYNEIYNCNAALTGVSNSNGVTPSIKQQLIGEAKFLRGFLYFYAVNLYGDVPLLLTTDYQANAIATRTPKAKVYQQIVQDLLDAQSALSNNWVDQNGNTTTEKIRPNKWAATALLARVYLFMGSGHYADAEVQATAVINNTALSLPTDLTKVFTANSAEAIFQFHPVDPTYTSTYIAHYYVLTSAPGTGNFYVSISPQLKAAFEVNDKRYTTWVGTYTNGLTTYLYPNKYRIYQTNTTGEYPMILRLAEQYLIRAEARAQQGNLTGFNSATSDINIIRTRAGLANTTAATQTDILTAIAKERQVELFTEWGDRWFDLIRTGNIDNVMGSAGGNVCALKGGSWDPNWILVPLPQTEILKDDNLIQNPGYQ